MNQMDTLVILDLRPVWPTLRALYDSSMAKALMITYEVFMETVFEAYRVEMNKPGSSDVILESAVDLHFTNAPDSICESAKRGMINAVNIIDHQLLWVVNHYFNAGYLGGIKTISMVPNTYTLHVVYGKEEV
jgi:hypothetical protein